MSHLIHTNCAVGKDLSVFLLLYFNLHMYRCKTERSRPITGSYMTIMSVVLFQIRVKMYIKWDKQVLKSENKCVLVIFIA